MKKLLLFILLLSQIGLMAQNCIPNPLYRDSTGSAVYPRPRSATYPNEGINTPGCVGKSFEFLFTVRIPSTFMGTALTAMSLATTGAVAGLPTGISYSCNPPNCRFLADSLGCIKLSGVIDNATVPGIFPLTINGTLDLGGFMFPVSFPNASIAPGTYEIVVKEATATECTTKTNEKMLAHYTLIYPNPAYDKLGIEWDVQMIQYKKVELISREGKVIHKENIGENERGISINVENIPSGIYLIRLMDASSTLTKSWVKF
ncbi:MAG: T9SS type A sorting domain-containing protein [Saprospiraceae bacterium]|jgi:hypothetical protein|nr:T9SS type A sorting domain-containing protein [Saprospiraceae bacterium]